MAEESGIDPNGVKDEGLTDYIFGDQIFFNELSRGFHTPRSIFVDSEPLVIDALQRGRYNGMYQPHQFIVEGAHSAINWARGYYSMGF